MTRAEVGSVHITLPWTSPPLSLNDSKSGRAQMSAKARVRDDMIIVCRALRLPRFEVPVMCLLTWYRTTNRVADSDNLAATQKRCLDGAVRAGLLVDDSPTYVPMTLQRVILRRDNPWPDAGERLVFSLLPHLAEIVHIRPSRSATLAEVEASP